MKYTKYNPLDEDTLPPRGCAVLVVMWNREDKEWGVDAGYADDDALATLWANAHKGADIYWMPVIFPKEAE